MVNEESTSAGRQTDEEALQEALQDVSAESESLRDASSESSAGQTNIDELKQSLADANKRILMAQAELENFRKRTRREQSEQLKYAMLPLVRDLLPVIDNFQRAMGAVPGGEAHANGSDDPNVGMTEGIRMVQQMLIDVLGQHGCQEIPAAGVAFDPTYHEAVGQMPSDEVPAGHVLKVMQAGFRLHDRVVRPSQVIVSQGDAE